MSGHAGVHLGCVPYGKKFLQRREYGVEKMVMSRASCTASRGKVASVALAVCLTRLLRFPRVTSLAFIYIRVELEGGI